jgi:hypothetical protein
LSDPRQAAIERELGASVRTFCSVAAALRWFAEVAAGPAPLRAMPLEQGPGPRSAESRSERDATHAAILCAVAEVHHAPLLVEWTLAWRTERDMAQDEGFSSVKAMRHALRRTEQLLAVHLRERGVLK